MTAITVSSLRQLAPNSGVKEIAILTDSACATGFTFDATNYFDTIWSVYISDSSGVVKTATFSSLTVTVGTVSTGVHCIRILGV